MRTAYVAHAFHSNNSFDYGHQITAHTMNICHHRNRQFWFKRVSNSILIPNSDANLRTANMLMINCAHLTFIQRSTSHPSTRTEQCYNASRATRFDTAVSFLLFVYFTFHLELSSLRWSEHCVRVHVRLCVSVCISSAWNHRNIAQRSEISKRGTLTDDFEQIVSMAIGNSAGEPKAIFTALFFSEIANSIQLKREREQELNRRRVYVL